MASRKKVQLVQLAILTVLEVFSLRRLSRCGTGQSALRVLRISSHGIFERHVHNSQDLMD